MKEYLPDNPKRKHRAIDMQGNDDGEDLFPGDDGFEYPDLSKNIYIREDGKTFFRKESCSEFDKDGESVLDKYIQNTEDYFRYFEIYKATYLLKAKVNTLRLAGIGDSLVLNQKIQEIVATNIDKYIHLSIAGIQPFPEYFENLVSIKQMTDEIGFDLRSIVVENQDFLLKEFIDYVYDVTSEERPDKKQLANIKSYYKCFQVELGISRLFVLDAFQGIKIRVDNKSIELIEFCESKENEYS